MTLEAAILHVWRETLVNNARTIAIGKDSFPVIATPKQKLQQVNFRFEGRELRGIEQNPKTKSRWAAMARSGKKVMQFVEHGRYIAVVADGKCIPYERHSKDA